MNGSSPRPAKRPWLILLLIVFVILGPMLFAWILVKRAQTHEFKRSNYGDLIASPPNISKVQFYDLKRKSNVLGGSFLGRWWLIYVGPHKCYQECQSTLYNLRQLQLALGKDAIRVDRMFIAPPQCPQALCESFLLEFYPELTRTTLSASDFNKIFLDRSKAVETETLGQIYIIDPLGNVILSYSPEIETKNILSDLKRLLKASHIG